VPDDQITIIEGDCLQLLPTLEPGSVDLVVTSPPYNQLGSRIGSGSGSGRMKGDRWIAKVAARGYADDMPEPEYREWLSAVAAALAVVVRPGGSFFFNHKVRYRDGEMLHPLDYVRDWPGWAIRQEVIWDRGSGFAFNSGIFAPSDERLYWLVKPGGKWAWNAGASSMFTVWRVQPNNTAKGSIDGHPCPYPLEIPARCIDAVTSPGDLVLDPFGGSGTTAVAAMKAGRRCVLIEKDPRYIPTIRRRVAEARTPLLDLCGPAAPAPTLFDDATA
jgi:modification methylase